MKIKKGLIIAILATLCLAVTLFATIPTRSQSGSSYDPWVDVNDDGSIDMADISIAIDSFMTTGTPINKTALLLELQTDVDSLNASVIELQSRVAALEFPPDLIVTTYANQTVLRLDHEGNIVWKVDIGSPTHEACWNPDGTIYVISNSYLTKLYSNGTIIWNKEIGGDKIDVDPNDGSVYVVSLGAGLWKYSSDGTFLWYLEGDNVQSVAVNPTDGSVCTNTYVDGVYKYDPDGNLLWHTPIPGGYQNSYGANSIAVNPMDGSVVAIMRFDGPATKMDANGNIVWTTFFASDKGSVKIDPFRNAVYVRGNNYLNKLCLGNGKVIWGCPVSGDPMGVGVNCRDGSLYTGGWDCALSRNDQYTGSRVWSKSLGYIVFSITFEFKFVPFDADK